MITQPSLCILYSFLEVRKNKIYYDANGNFTNIIFKAISLKNFSQKFLLAETQYLNMTGCKTKSANFLTESTFYSISGFASTSDPI